MIRGSSPTQRVYATALLLPCLLLACPKKNPSTNTVAGDAATVSVSDGGPDAGAIGDDVQTVYPIEPDAPPVPLAEKLCQGLTEMPEKKRAVCCSSTPGMGVTADCTRALSAAVRYKAVAIVEADVDRCIAAFDKTLDGCDWVGPSAPLPPPECQGILKGLLGEGTKCRSSLECTGQLRCQGVGPTAPGRCSQPRLPGELCGGTVDTLTTYVRQNDLGTQHPDCSTGHCIKHRCAVAVGQGNTCQASQDCAEGLQCLSVGRTTKVAPKARSAPAPQKKCVRHSLPKEGEPCPGGVCALDLQCIANKCAVRKLGGQPCSSDFECRGGCLRTGGGAKGVCGPRCDLQ